MTVESCSESGSCFNSQKNNRYPVLVQAVFLKKGSVTWKSSQHRMTSTVKATCIKQCLQRKAVQLGTIYLITARSHKWQSNIKCPFIQVGWCCNCRVFNKAYFIKPLCNEPCWVFFNPNPKKWIDKVLKREYQVSKKLYWWTKQEIYLFGHMYILIISTKCQGMDLHLQQWYYYCLTCRPEFGLCCHSKVDLKGRWHKMWQKPEQINFSLHFMDCSK